MRCQAPAHSAPPALQAVSRPGRSPDGRQRPGRRAQRATALHLAAAGNRARGCTASGRPQLAAQPGGAALRLPDALLPGRPGGLRIRPRSRAAGGVGPRAGWLRNAAKPTPAALHVLPSSVTCDWPTSSQSLMFAVSASGAPAGAAAAAAAAAAAPAPHVSRLSGRSWVSRARPAREVPAGALQRPRGRAVLVALAGARCGRARSLVAALPNCSRSTSRTQRLATVHPGAMCLLPRLVCTRPALRRCHDSYACSPPKGSAAAASARRLTVKDVRRMPSGARSRAPSACTRRITILGTLGHAGASPSWGP